MEKRSQASCHSEHREESAFSLSVILDVLNRGSRVFVSGLRNPLPSREG